MHQPKLSRLAVAVVFAASTGLASAEIEVSGYIKNESAFTTQGGQFIGEGKSRTDNSGNSGGDTIKFENSARIFMNGEFGQESAWHLDLNLIYDSEGVESEFRGHENYTQNDWLREAYIDTKWGDTDVRIGKQQVVWGTADGIKLLDIINPTDFREVNQNLTEDARIPIWMINTDTPIGESGSLQFILSQAEENKIPGLDKDGDRGQPYKFKGVDTITGPVNGFLNIGPAMGQVARFFGLAAGGGANLSGFTGATVQEFVDDDNDANNFDNACNAEGLGATTSYNCLSQLINESNNLGGNAAFPLKGGNEDGTNIDDFRSTGVFNASNPDSIIEYMSSTTFATFQPFAGMTTSYRRDYPSNTDGNFGFRYKNTTDSGINWSVNYFNHYDANPYVGLSWEDQNGNPLAVTYTNTAAGAAGNANGGATTTVNLQSGGANILPQNLGGTQTANLIFTEKLNRIQSYGSSFDMSIDSLAVPMVIRGEFLYDRDVKTPVIDRAALSIGDLEAALTNQDADFFKYVIGVDITVAKNLLISTQFIQFRNLDFVDTASTPSRNGVVSNVSGVKYTGDAPTLSLSNGLQKAEENKEFVSIFFSKPFGADQQGRWNNITILEDTGGYWNRFDVEYGFSDELVGSVELNTYWGDENSWFGQLENSSNVQVGMKYIFD